MVELEELRAKLRERVPFFVAAQPPPLNTFMITNDEASHAKLYGPASWLMENDFYHIMVGEKLREVHWVDVDAFNQGFKEPLERLVEYLHCEFGLHQRRESMETTWLEAMGEEIWRHHNETPSLLSKWKMPTGGRWFYWEDTRRYEFVANKDPMAGPEKRGSLHFEEMDNSVPLLVGAVCRRMGIGEGSENNINRKNVKIMIEQAKAHFALLEAENADA